MSVNAIAKLVTRRDWRRRHDIKRIGAWLCIIVAAKLARRPSMTCVRCDGHGVLIARFDVELLAILGCGADPLSVLVTPKLPYK